VLKCIYLYVVVMKNMLSTQSDRPLSHRENSFAENFITSKTATEAARNAGYLCNPGSQASRLLKRSRVQIAITQARRDLSVSNKIDQDRVVQMLLKAFENASNKGKSRDMTRAAAELGKLCGLYP
jgi:phage terminase small subunit